MYCLSVQYNSCIVLCVNYYQYSLILLCIVSIIVLCVIFVSSITSMDAGEVFVLLNRLNDDWGWGQSQRTSECGLIPLLLMEDVVIIVINSY